MRAAGGRRHFHSPWRCARSRAPALTSRRCVDAAAQALAPHRRRTKAAEPDLFGPQTMCGERLTPMMMACVQRSAILMSGLRALPR